MSVGSKSSAGENFGTVTRRALQLFPIKVAVEQGDLALTYEQLDARAQAVAGMLEGLGVASGDRVLLMFPNDHRFMECVLGVLRHGAVVVPLNVRLGNEALALIASDSGAEVIVAHADLAAKAQAVRARATTIRHTVAVERQFDGSLDYERELAEAGTGHRTAVVAGNDVAMQLYTSGSTGIPKGCLLSHAGHWWQARSSARTMLLDERDKALVMGPLYHANALWGCMLPMLHSGGAVSVVPRFAPGDVLHAIARHQCTYSSGTPAMFRMLLDAPELDAGVDLSSLQLLLCGSAPVPVALMQEITERFGCVVVEGYGLTEGGSNVMTPRWGVKKLGSAGLPVPDVKLRVVAVDNPERECAVGEIGELWSRCPANALGYHDRPEATAERFIAGGWLRTGDLVHRDDQGYVYIAGRIDDMINCGGEHVYPKEVERVLLDHPDIIEACVVGAPHRVKGSAPVAWVVLASERALTEDDVKRHSLDRGAPFAHPRRVFFVDELPLTGTSKVDRHRLRLDVGRLLPEGLSD